MNSRGSSLAILSFLSVALCYADRVLMSIVIIPISIELDLGKETQGAILSAFFVGYLLTQILGGRLADRYGGAKILAICVVLWSLFTLLTPIAAVTSIALLLVTRALMGAGEGGAFPSIWSLYARHLPDDRRAQAMTFTVSGIPVGTIITLSITPLIISQYGWEAPFYIFGALGFLWLACWYPQTETLTVDRQSYSVDKIQSESISVRQLLKSKPVLAIIVAHFSANWTTYVVLTWLPMFVIESFEVDFKSVGFWASVPAVSSIVCLNISGLVTGKLLKQGFDTTTIRKLMTAIGFGGSAAALSFIGVAESALSAIAIMSVCTGVGSFAMGGFGVNHADIAPKHAGTLMGLSNTAGTLPGIIGVYVTGLILEQTGSWALVFGTAAFVSIIGLLAFLFWGTAKRQF